MIDFLYSLPDRSVFINIATAISVTVMILLILLKYRITFRMAVVSAMSAFCTLTSFIGSNMARKLYNGQWRDIEVFVENIFEYEGTHYIGAVIYIVCIAPFLWNIVMKKEKSTFSKHGMMDYINILSVYIILQGFIGRIGCLSEGCCHGRIYDGIFSVPTVGMGYNTYPSLWIELILLFITLILVLITYFKKQNSITVCTLGYALSVFTAEFTYDRTGALIICGLSVIQYLAVILGIIALLYYRINKKSNEEAKK